MIVTISFLQEVETLLHSQGRVPFNKIPTSNKLVLEGNRGVWLNPTQSGYAFGGIVKVYRWYRGHTPLFHRNSWPWIKVEEAIEQANKLEDHEAEPYLRPQVIPVAGYRGEWTTYCFKIEATGCCGFKYGITRYFDPWRRYRTCDHSFMELVYSARVHNKAEALRWERSALKGKTRFTGLSPFSCGTGTTEIVLQRGA